MELEAEEEGFANSEPEPYGKVVPIFFESEALVLVILVPWSTAHSHSGLPPLYIGPVSPVLGL